MDSTKLVTRVSLLALLCAAGVQARAAGRVTPQSEDLSKQVRSGSKITYFDLLRELLPDLQEDSTAHRTIPFRSLSEPRKREAVEGDIKLDFKPYWFRSGGRRLLLLWVNISAEEANAYTPYEGEAEVLAVFSLEPKARMLDALEVKTDRFTGFWEDRPLFTLDSRNDAFIIYSTHWNAGESYTSIEMLFVDAGRFKKIASLFLYETQGCGANFTEAPTFRAAADSGNKYPKVLVNVKLRKGPDEEGCERPTRAFTKYYQGLYRWNSAKGRYVSNSRGLASFDRFNERRAFSP